MKTQRVPRIGLAILLALLVPLAALAHSTVKRTVPASGSVLAASPAQVSIEFGEPASLTSVVVEAAGHPDRKLEFTPAGSATQFTIKDPGLSAGRSELKWKALSKDGHPISGTIILVVKPGAAPR